MRRTGGPSPVYVSMESTDAHCAYTWRKLHRAILRGTPIDSQIGEFKHTKHCSKALAIARDAEKYPQCESDQPDSSMYSHSVSCLKDVNALPTITGFCC